MIRSPKPQTTPSSAVHEAENLIRYIENDLSPDERSATERHLLVCEPCRDFLSFVREFNDSLRSAKPESPGPDEPHPDPSLIVALAAEELDETIAQEVRAHLLFCEDCSDEFTLIELVAREGVETSWRQRIQQLWERMLILGKSYGIGTMLGPLRILTEAPAFAMRGGSTADIMAKSVEVTVGENAYGVQFHMSADRTVTCDIAGFRTPVKSPLEIAIVDESGEKVAASKTDTFGNGRISIPQGGDPTGFWLLMLSCGAAEEEILFRASEP